MRGFTVAALALVAAFVSTGCAGGHATAVEVTPPADQLGTTVCGEDIQIRATTRGALWYAFQPPAAAGTINVSSVLHQMVTLTGVGRGESRVYVLLSEPYEGGSYDVTVPWTDLVADQGLGSTIFVSVDIVTGLADTQLQAGTSVSIEEYDKLVKASDLVARAVEVRTLCDALPAR